MFGIETAAGEPTVNRDKAKLKIYPVDYEGERVVVVQFEAADASGAAQKVDKIVKRTEDGDLRFEDIPADLAEQLATQDEDRVTAKEKGPSNHGASITALEQEGEQRAEVIGLSVQRILYLREKDVLRRMGDIPRQNLIFTTFIAVARSQNYLLEAKRFKGRQVAEDDKTFIDNMVTDIDEHLKATINPDDDTPPGGQIGRREFLGGIIGAGLGMGTAERLTSDEYTREPEGIIYRSVDQLPANTTCLVDLRDIPGTRQFKRIFRTPIIVHGEEIGEKIYVELHSFYRDRIEIHKTKEYLYEPNDWFNVSQYPPNTRTKIDIQSPGFKNAVKILLEQLKKEYPEEMKAVLEEVSVDEWITIWADVCTMHRLTTENAITHIAGVTRYISEITPILKKRNLKAQRMSYTVFNDVRPYYQTAKIKKLFPELIHLLTFSDYAYSLEGRLRLSANFREDRPSSEDIHQKAFSTYILPIIDTIEEFKGNEKSLPFRSFMQRRKVMDYALRQTQTELWIGRARMMHIVPKIYPEWDQQLTGSLMQRRDIHHSSPLQAFYLFSIAQDLAPKKLDQLIPEMIELKDYIRKFFGDINTLPVEGLLQTNAGLGFEQFLDEFAQVCIHARGIKDMETDPVKLAKQSFEDNVLRTAMLRVLESYRLFNVMRSLVEYSGANVDHIGDLSVDQIRDIIKKTIQNEKWKRFNKKVYESIIESGETDDVLFKTLYYTAKHQMPPKLVKEKDGLKTYVSTFYHEDFKTVKYYVTYRDFKGEDKIKTYSPNVEDGVETVHVMEEDNKDLKHVYKGRFNPDTAEIEGELWKVIRKQGDVFIEETVGAKIQPGLTQLAKRKGSTRLEIVAAVSMVLGAVSLLVLGKIAVLAGIVAATAGGLGVVTFLKYYSRIAPEKDVDTGLPGMPLRRRTFLGVVIGATVGMLYSGEPAVTEGGDRRTGVTYTDGTIIEDLRDIEGAGQFKVFYKYTRLEDGVEVGESYFCKTETTGYPGAGTDVYHIMDTYYKTTDWKYGRSVAPTPRTSIDPGNPKIVSAVKKILTIFLKYYPDQMKKVLEDVSEEDWCEIWADACEVHRLTLESAQTHLLGVALWLDQIIPVLREKEIDPQRLSYTLFYDIRPYTQTAEIKKAFPSLVNLLSLGDFAQNEESYLWVLEKHMNRTRPVNMKKSRERLHNEILADLFDETSLVGAAGEFEKYKGQELTLPFRGAMQQIPVLKRALRHNEDEAWIGRASMLRAVSLIYPEWDQKLTGALIQRVTLHHSSTLNAFYLFSVTQDISPSKLVTMAPELIELKEYIYDFYGNLEDLPIETLLQTNAGLAFEQFLDEFVYVATHENFWGITTDTTDIIELAKKGFEDNVFRFAMIRVLESYRLFNVLRSLVEYSGTDVEHIGDLSADQIRAILKNTIQNDKWRRFNKNVYAAINESGETDDVLFKTLYYTAKHQMPPKLVKDINSTRTYVSTFYHKDYETVKQYVTYRDFKGEDKIKTYTPSIDNGMDTVHVMQGDNEDLKWVYKGRFNPETAEIEGSLWKVIKRQGDIFIEEEVGIKRVPSKSLVAKRDGKTHLDLLYGIVLTFGFIGLVKVSNTSLVMGLLLAIGAIFI